MTLEQYLRSPVIDRWCGSWVARWLDASLGLNILASLDEAELERAAGKGGIYVAHLADRVLIGAGFRRLFGPSSPGDPVYAMVGDTLAMGIWVCNGMAAFKDDRAVIVTGAKPLARWCYA